MMLLLKQHVSNVYAATPVGEARHK